MMSFFNQVPLVPPDPILGLTVAFYKDTRPNKVNLGVGLFHNEELRTPVLGSVKIAEQHLLESEKSKEYLPISGDSQFVERMGELVFGEEIWKRESHRIAGFQSVGGTGALRIGGTFIKEEIEGHLLISMPSWPNHKGVFSACKLVVDEYPYFDQKTFSLDFHAMFAHLEQLPERTIVLLHASCHNPTGCDPSIAQWEALSDLFKSKKLIPFFDCAYQGFGDGVEEDAGAIRLFAKNGLEMFLAVSCAKNFSLYGERTGALFIVSQNGETAEHIKSRTRQVIRQNYSTPPLHGAKIVGHILSTPVLRKQWLEELTGMRNRINTMRASLTEGLSSPLFDHMGKGKGMFGYSGLNPAQVEKLMEEFGIYLTRDGRINVCGLNRQNIDYVVKAMLAVSSYA